MEFHIVENHEDNFDFYENFKKDFFDVNMLVQDIIAKYDLSRIKYDKLRKRICDENNVDMKPHKNHPSPVRNNENKYIGKHRNKWRIVRRINGEIIYFGYYDDIVVARKIVKELEKVDWDKSKLEEIREKIMG